MAQLSTLTLERGVLPYVTAFHVLRAKASRRCGLTLSEGRMLDLLLDLFEPRHITAEGVVRCPVAIPLHRGAELNVAGRAYPAIADGASVLEIDLNLPDAPPADEPVELAVEGNRKGLWWHFKGTIARRSNDGKRLRVRLEESLDSDQANSLVAIE